MTVSYEGIGQWAATFACGSVFEGQMVKVSGNGKVGSCSAGERFCGQVLSVCRGGGACSVVLGGIVTVFYSGSTAPTVGWCGLVSDGTGGVLVDPDGHSYLVVEVDKTTGTVTFAL
ncbi:MAG: hypothetical protein Q4C45_03645 [Oscillospiraceae bacterium]|nr:hypothetical protein [Oscillospiraceae bacterium]